MNNPFLRAQVLALGAFLLLTAPTPTSAQAADSSGDDSDRGPTCSKPNFAGLDVEISSKGKVFTELEACFDSKYDATLRRSIPEALDCQIRDEDTTPMKGDGISGRAFRCHKPAVRTGLSYSGEFNISKLVQSLRRAGVDTFYIDVDLPVDGYPKCTPAPARPLGPEVICEYVLSLAEGSSTNLPESIHFESGFNRTRLAASAAILTLLLVLPLIVAFWFRRRAATVATESIPSFVFAHRRFLWFAALAGVLAWWLAIDLLRIDDLVDLLVSGKWLNAAQGWSTAALALMWIPPAFVYFACLVISSPVSALRGIQRTNRQTIRLSFWGMARFVLPIGLIVVGILLMVSDVSVAVVLILAGVFASQWVQRRYAAASSMQLQSLSSGELRDQVFAIAAQGKAVLGQLYILPAEQMRMANAFAHAGKNIFLTDYLLKNLNKREIDAIVAHEVTHLTAKHAKKRVFIYLGLLIPGMILGAVFDNRLGSHFPVGPLVFTVILFVLFLVSRRNEFTADAGAVKITGDAASLITGLAKVSSLNTMPIHWNKLDEKMLTHPSTFRRMKRLAKLGGISDAQLTELLNQAKERPTDTYEIPAGALSPERVFSSQFKSAWTRRTAWTVIFSAAIIPSVAALVANRANFSGWPLAVCYLAGIAISIFAALALRNFVSCSGTEKLENGLRENFAKDDALQKTTGGIFVYLSPAASPRIFENMWAWDVGLLSIDNDRLDYRGEEARFGLPRERVTRIFLGPGPVTWGECPAIYIECAALDGSLSTFGIRTLRGRSDGSNTRLTKSLFADLQRWQRGEQTLDASLAVGQAGNASAAEPAGVAFGDVTSTSPKSVARAAIFVRTLYLDCFIGTAVAVLFGFRVGAMETSATPANSTGESIAYVILAMALTHAVLFFPYWRYRDPAEKPNPSAAAPSPAQSVG